MVRINTALGPIDLESLGLTLAHEHVVAGYPGWACHPFVRPYNREKMVDVCLRSRDNQ